MTEADSLLGGEVLALLPAVVRECMTSSRWWEDELVGVHVMNALSDMSLPHSLKGYCRVDTADSVQWRWKGHALIHESSLVHRGVNFFGPVLIGPDCEVGPNTTVYGPTIVESGTYLGRGAEIRRCLLLAGAEAAHMSYVGHSVLGRGVRLGAFFCVAVRNLRRGTVHMMSDGALVDTGEITIGCVIADGTQTGVRATVMPGRRIVDTELVPANAVVMKNC